MYIQHGKEDVNMSIEPSGRLDLPETMNVIALTEEELHGGRQWIREHQGTRVSDTPLWVLISLGVQSAKVPEWIPVSERLPEDKQSVLVWCPQYQNIYCAYLEKEQWWVFGAFVQIVPNEIVAWMPLPEPYKAESEEV